MPWRWQVELLFDADVDEVRRRLPAWVATVSTDPDGRVRATLRVENLDGVVRHLGGIGLPFHLIGPKELRPLLAEHARGLLAAGSA